MSPAARFRGFNDAGLTEGQAGSGAWYKLHVHKIIQHAAEKSAGCFGVENAPVGGGTVMPDGNGGGGKFGAVSPLPGRCPKHQGGKTQPRGQSQYMRYQMETYHKKQ